MKKVDIRGSLPVAVKTGERACPHKVKKIGDFDCPVWLIGGVKHHFFISLNKFGVWAMTGNLFEAKSHHVLAKYLVGENYLVGVFIPVEV